MRPALLLSATLALAACDANPAAQTPAAPPVAQPGAQPAATSATAALVAARRHIPTSFKAVFGPPMDAARTAAWEVAPVRTSDGGLTLGAAPGVAVDVVEGAGVYMADEQDVGALVVQAQAGAAYVIACDATLVDASGARVAAPAAVALLSQGRDLFNGAAQPDAPSLHVGVYRHGDADGLARLALTRAASAPAGARVLLFRCAAHEHGGRVSGQPVGPR